MVAALYSYNMGSAGSKALAESLGIRRIKHTNSKFNARGKTIINWGASDLPNHAYAGATKVLNRPEVVATATNKLSLFSLLLDQGLSVYIPWFTDNSQTARTRMIDLNKSIVGRKLLRGQGGEGLVIFDPDDQSNWDEMNECRMFCDYIPKRHEYRIHCVKNGDSVRDFLIQRKALREEFRGREDINWRVRNLANGFIFARNEDHVPHVSVSRAAKTAVFRSGLDFGAVDIVFNERFNISYVLEINTAPGLQGSTVEDYANALREII